MAYTIIKNGRVAPSEVDDLRAAVNWEIIPGQAQKALKKAYCYYTVRCKGRLVAYLSIISDGVADAFLVDFMVHPDFQHRGIGTRMVHRVFRDFKNKVQCVHATFNSEEAPFYKRAGFHIFKGGIFDFKHMRLP